MESKKGGDPDRNKSKQALGAKKLSEAGMARASATRGLDPRSQEAIGKALKAHYDDLVRAPVPDKFMELLDRLEARERDAKPRGGNDESGKL